MKTILIALAMCLVSLSSQAQTFELRTSVMPGVIIDNKLNFDLFNATYEVSPGIVIDSMFSVNAVTLTYNTNGGGASSSGFLAGLGVEYIYKNSIALGVEALAGNTGRQLLNGVFLKRLKSADIGFCAGYEFAEKQTWLSLRLGYRFRL